MSEVHTRFNRPWSKRRDTRSGIACTVSSLIVVTGVHGRGLIPRIPLARISVATVLPETTSPPSRRSARIRGAPLTPSDASWATVIFNTRSARRDAAGPGWAPCRAAHA